MIDTTIIDGILHTTCPDCGGDGYTEQLDLAAIHALSESPPYCRVKCDCEGGWAPVGCEECGEPLAADGVCGECLRIECAA